MKDISSEFTQNLPNLTNGMLAAAARDAKSKAIVLKSLAFASLPEREQRGGGPKKPPRSTEYLRYYGVTLGLSALRAPQSQ